MLFVSWASMLLCSVVGVLGVMMFALSVVCVVEGVL